MKRLSQQIIDFNNAIIDAENIRKLDGIHSRIIFSNLDNQTVTLFKHIIDLKAENLILKNLKN